MTVVTVYKANLTWKDKAVEVWIGRKGNFAALYTGVPEGVDWGPFMAATPFEIESRPGERGTTYWAKPAPELEPVHIFFQLIKSEERQRRYGFPYLTIFDSSGNMYQTHPVILTVTDNDGKPRRKVQVTVSDNVPPDAAAVIKAAYEQGGDECELVIGGPPTGRPPGSGVILSGVHGDELKAVEDESL